MNVTDCGGVTYRTVDDLKCGIPFKPVTDLGNTTAWHVRVKMSHEITPALPGDKLPVMNLTTDYVYLMDRDAAVAEMAETHELIIGEE